MSSLMVFGFFGVNYGCCVGFLKPGTTSKTYHCYYSTSLQTPTGDSYPAVIRVYSPFGDAILPDDTVVFLIAKAFLPPNDTVLLEASEMVTVPSDPSAEGYENSVPDRTVPFFISLGMVPSAVQILNNMKSKAFAVVSSDYMCDSMKQSTVLYVFHPVFLPTDAELLHSCVYDGSRAQWNRTPTPSVNSVVQYMGTFQGFHTGCFHVNADNIVLNIGVQDTGSTVPVSSPVKRRRFDPNATFLL